MAGARPERGAGEVPSVPRFVDEGEFDTTDSHGEAQIDGK